MARGSGREVIIEYHRIGNSVKVTATDPETLVEVSIVGPPGAGEEALRRVVLDKLAYVLGKRAGTAPTGAGR
jgi:Domain of unknown function (DUF6898)